MSTNILKVNNNISTDESITRYELHSYAPFTSISLNTADNIIISINQESAYLLPSESVIYVEGKIVKDDGSEITKGTTVELINNALPFLFNEVRLEINGVEIDSCKNVGIASTMKAYVSFSPNEIKKYEMTGWNKKLLCDDYSFSGYIPLKFILGFAETYRKIILNQKLDLILIRSNNTKDPIQCTGTSKDFKIQLNRVIWKCPHVSVRDDLRLHLLTQYRKNVPINMTFRKWSLSYYPSIPLSREGSWSLRTASNIEKPRYIILGFQTARDNDVSKDPSCFDPQTLTDIRVYLNSEAYPYEQLSIDFNKKQYLPLYLMYCNFQESYYSKDLSEPLLGYEEYLTKAPLCVIDTSKQSEVWKSGVSVDILVAWKFNSNPAANTVLYALIISDSFCKLYPLTNSVQKIL